VGVRTKGLPLGFWDDLLIVTPTEDELSFASTLPSFLGPGERTCIAIAHARHGLFATDDLNARRVAKRLDITLAGSTGILALSVRRGLLTLQEANGLLGTMIAGGYRAPVTDVAVALASVGPS